MNEKISAIYQELLQKYQTWVKKTEREIRMLSLARLISFVSILPVAILLGPSSLILTIILISALLILFLFLVKKFVKAERRLYYYQNLETINRNEIEALNYNFNAFDPGIEFIDHQHDYSFDLDLFGEPSFFQFLNRTVTPHGKKRLAAILKKTWRPKAEIIARQQAIEELAEKLTWRQHFMALGKEAVSPNGSTPVDELFCQSIPLKHEKATHYLPLVFPLLLVGSTLLFTINVLTGQIFMVAFLVQIIVYLFYARTISKFYLLFQHQGNLLRKVAAMLRQIEESDYNSEYLNALKSRLTTENKSASEITAELRRILDQFDYRQNIFVAFVLNFVLLWDIRCVAKLYRWQQKYSAKLPAWFDIIAETDALISLANCNFNHPEWRMPEVTDSGFCFESAYLGHPLIPEKRCVRNSFGISGEENIVVITGANMAGKSTFLRTVGINMILASSGCKVFATAFKFSPVRLFTNMRTTDNLMKDESYFYAELLRLQTLLQLLRNGSDLLVIVDEMLKGTNSVDKLNGSKALIQQLISLETHGIVATHDLGLTELATSYPGKLKNQCFEVRLNENELSFDYTLKDGVTKTMNATFLMKKMGIIPPD